jgi:hypothetical protein
VVMRDRRVDHGATLQGQRPNAKIWGGDEYHTALNVCPPKITVPL